MAHIGRPLKILLQNVCRQHVRMKTYWPVAVHPEEEKTYAQRLAELNKKDPILDRDINIGYPVKKQTRLERRKARLQSSSESSEKTVTGPSKVLLDEVQEGYNTELRPHQWKTLAEHYGIYRDLFDNAIFYPIINMDIEFDYDELLISKVYMGNRLKPREVKTRPNVHYDAEPDSLCTLAMTAPDSHLQDNNMEYLHWLVGNIPGCDINKGEELCNYLPPIPVLGTGYHRCVFVLYKQDKHIDFSQMKRPQECNSLQERSFSTLEFYRGLQDDMTPAGLHMFQCDWDESVRETFWNTLDMKEPRYEFKYPPPYHPVQKRFPHKQPFNVYLDRYRDVKELNEEVLRDKLKELKPFEAPEKDKYPMLNLIRYKQISGIKPNWMKAKLRNKYLKKMQWSEREDRIS